VGEAQGGGSGGLREDEVPPGGDCQEVHALPRENEGSHHYRVRAHFLLGLHQRVDEKQTGMSALQADGVGAAVVAIEGIEEGRRGAEGIITIQVFSWHLLLLLDGVMSIICVFVFGPVVCMYQQAFFLFSHPLRTGEI